MSEQIYPYAVSKIRVKELNILTKHELDNMADEENMTKIKSTLSDKGYNFDIIDKIEDFETVLKNESIKLYALIKELIPDSKFANIFLCKNDYHNAKLILKAKIVGKDYEESLVDAGIIEVSKLIDNIENSDYSDLSEYMQEGITEIKNYPDYEKKPYIIDCKLDAKSFEEMKQIAKDAKCEFIVNYVEKLIDITNLRTFFRVLRNHNKDKNIFEESFINGGTIDKEVFLESFDMDLQDSKLKNKIKEEIFNSAITNPKAFDSFCDNYIMEYMKESKFKALTIEPIVAYIYAKETEIKNVRILLTGKINNINPKIIKERLRNSYV